MDPLGCWAAMKHDLDKILHGFGLQSVFLCLRNTLARSNVPDYQGNFRTIKCKLG